MLKTSMLLFIFFTLFLIPSCQKDTSPIIITPDWLNQYIADIQDNPEYYGTKIYRYEWEEKIVYRVMIPISSCAYCDVYDQRGSKIKFKDDADFQDFINNIKNEVVVWEWKMKY